MKKMIIVEAICGMIGGMAAALVSGLAQWIDSGSTPGSIAWAVIIATTIGAGANNLRSFLSESWARYRANGRGLPQDTVNK